MLLYSFNEGIFLYFNDLFSYQVHWSHYPRTNYKFDVRKLNMAFFNVNCILR